MKKINVIDLDKTLIPYDSLRVFIKSELKGFNVYFWSLTIRRVLRLISSASFKKKIIVYLVKKDDNDRMRSFAKEVVKQINPQVMECIRKETAAGTINVLVSASPQLYVRHIIDELGWKGSGSYIDAKGNFVHLYAMNKIEWLKMEFSQREYEYNFAISDSSSDDELLSLFKKSLKWK